MRESNYNMYFDTFDGKKLAFNSVTCALAIVDERYDELIQNIGNITHENCPERLREIFFSAMEGNFIVPDETDELMDLLVKRNCQKYSTEHLGLTIAPTLACNFKCIYCFETSKPGVMSDEVIDRLVNFIRLKSKNLNHLDITWYGGEPLLCPDIINRLSEAFIDICDSKGIAYGAYMITNGSLLNDVIIDNMLKYRITGVQITLDGPPEIHDSRRINKLGESTFDVIVSNINSLLATGKIDVALRINVDKTNEYALEELLGILSERLISKNVKISFGQVTAYTDACKSVESTCFDNKEFAINMIKYYESLKRYGFDEYNEFPYPYSKYNYCCAEILQALVLDHEGNVYKCWNQVGDVPSSIGNLMDENFDLTNYKHGKWLERDIVTLGECSTCKFLPVCMGGCPYNDVVLNKGKSCDVIKYNVKETMLKYYDSFIVNDDIDNC